MQAKGREKMKKSVKLVTEKEGRKKIQKKIWFVEKIREIDKSPARLTN